MSSVPFSIIGVDPFAERTQGFLAPYNKTRPADGQVNVSVYSWEDYKQELTQMAIHGRGMGVSQVGAPAVNDLIAMNVLRPFSGSEFAAMGGESAFTRAGWENTKRISDGQIWAIPWLVDPRGLLYWRDMLEDAGVDETTAFQNVDNVEATLQKLQRAGNPNPLGLAISNSLLAGQTTCSWVWGAGGEFVSPDGKTALFTEPPFIRGLQAYFRLAPYLPHEGTSIQIMSDAVQLFLDRKVAVLYGSLWVVMNFIFDETSLAFKRLGLALPPGAPYAGGSSLVIWKDTRNEDAAVQLVQYLTGRDAQANYPLLVNHLPARADVLAEPPYSTNPLLKGFVNLANAARAFPTIQLGGMLEGLYGTAITRIWKKVAVDPGVDTAPLIQREMAILARRFQSWVS